MASPRSRSPRIPKYRLHKVSGQAVVTLSGRDIYLGPHGSDESHTRYHDEVARWQLQTRIPERAVAVGKELTISELFVAYWQHVKAHYSKDGEPTSEVSETRQSMRDLFALYGKEPVGRFGPLALKTVRQAMIERGLSRGVVNQRIGRIKRMFKWGVANELVEPATLQALQAVTGLQRGRSEAREAAPVRPAPEDMIEAVLGHLSSPVASMVRLQTLTGMRPGEVVILRPCDVDREGGIWLYRPESHKTEHHGRERRIFLGPKAQEVLSPFLLRAPSSYCFSPAEAMQEKRDQRTAARKTPRSCGNRVGTNRKPKPAKEPRERYDTNSYRRAIAYACAKCYPPPKDFAGEALTAWKREHRFHPHQLRHNAATYLAKTFGIEAAQTVLGHATLTVTQVYAERDYAKAAEIMKQVG